MICVAVNLFADGSVIVVVVIVLFDCIEGRGGRRLDRRGGRKERFDGGTEGILVIRIVVVVVIIRSQSRKGVLLAASADRRSDRLIGTIVRVTVAATRRLDEKELTKKSNQDADRDTKIVGNECEEKMIGNTVENELWAIRNATEHEKADKRSRE
jgi:hypothetical protein